MPRQGLLRAAFDYPLTKTVSLVLAAFLWFYVNAELSEERAFDVRLAIRAPDDFMLVGDAPPTVRVKLHGQRGRIGALTSGELLVRFQPKSVTVGRATYALAGEDFHLPHGIALADAPPRVELAFARVYSRFLDVRVQYTGEPSPRHEVEGVSADPGRVEVRGAKEILDTLTTVSTRPVDITGRTETVTQHVRIEEAFEHEGRSVRIYCGEQVLATVQIRGKRIRKKVEDVPVRVLGASAASGAARVEPAKVEIWVECAAEDVARLGAAGVTAYVDLAGLRPGEPERRPVQVVPPAGVSVVSVTPREVGVVLERRR